MLGIFRRKAQAATDKLSGRTDLFEACVAASALVAVADGSIEDSEVAAIAKAIKGSKAFAGIDKRHADHVINTMLDRAQNGRVGKSELKQELRELRNPEDGELALLFALDVSDADGENEEAEVKVMREIAEILGVNYDQLAA